MNIFIPQKTLDYSGDLLVLILSVSGTFAKEKSPHRVYKEYLDKRKEGKVPKNVKNERGLTPHQAYKEHLDSLKDKPPAPKERKERKERKGKACGDGYISKDKECHIGQPAPEKPKISPAIIAAPVAAAAGVYAISKPAKKPVMTGMCRKDVKLTVFSTAFDFMCFDNPLMCR